MKYSIGQKLKIIDVDEFPEYSGRIGIITEINQSKNLLYGTWGSCPLLIGFDIFKIL